MSAIRSPNRPPIATKPKNAITVVIVAAKTGINILWAAVSAATIGGKPDLAR